MDDGQKKLVKRLEALSWATIFIWLGIFLLLKLERDGILALGVGSIILGENTLRKYFELEISKFWIAMGLLFLVFGVLDFFNLAYFPIFLIVCGILIILRYVMPKKDRE
jgi:hypothetical protein